MKGICKSLRIKERQLKNKSKAPRQPGLPLWYKVDPNDSRQLILKNGTRLRQPVAGVPIYCSKGGMVYTLTPWGLRMKNISYCRSRRYCQLTGTGRSRFGQRYPYIIFRHVKYQIHVIMTLAWKRKRRKGEEIDHINGNIDDCRAINLRIITKEKNLWCGGIIRRLRNASKKYNLPLMNPVNRTPQDMLELFNRFAKRKDIKAAMNEEIERQKVLHALVHASIQLGDPTLDPRNMTRQRREEILRKYRVDDPCKVMDDDLTHHREI